VTWLLSREIIIALALLGGAASVLAIALQRRPNPSAATAKRLNLASYVFMGASVVLFIISGLRGGAA
jgi:uncharacterized membrane protein